MFFSIVNSYNDEKFADCVKNIEEAFWPESLYEKQVNALAKEKSTTKPDERIKEINQKLLKMVDDICSQENGLYKILGTNNGQENPKTLRLPFLDRYHKLFLQRQYNIPLNYPKNQFAYLINLENKTSNNAAWSCNYSKHYGNYNHFINVVMATARIVDYFRSHEKILEHFGTLVKDTNFFRELGAKLCFTDCPNIRTFKLILSAFYHDIGKTIVDHRHGMEGSFIIADHTTSSLSQLNIIVKEYHMHHEWEREDLLEISNFLYYHDSFGTLGTGESSYTLLTDIIDRIKRSSMKYLEKSSEYISSCYQSIFDLWILNIADIIVSSNSKFNYQKIWLKAKSANEVIAEFLSSDSGMCRIHDFDVAIRLLTKHNEGIHNDDTIELDKLALRESKAHTIERIRRLVCSSLRPAIVQFRNDYPEAQQVDNILENIMRTEQKNGISTNFFDIGIIHNIIFRSIQSLNDPTVFYERLSCIISMDYALGFFTKIAYRAIEKINTEIEDGLPTTGWIRSRTAQQLDTSHADYVQKANAIFFLDNYCAIVVRILAHLLFRESSIDRVSNIEFEDARNRLINEKIDKILGLEGPYRQNKSIELILKTVFVY
jgi:hypothetical protein